jgi:hypothetical protein
MIMRRPTPGSHDILQPKADGCACGGGCPRCGGIVIGGERAGNGVQGAPAPASGSRCGSTPSGEDLGPTNALGRDGLPRKRPRLCRAKFTDTHLGLNKTEVGLRGDNKGRISVAAPEGLSGLISGCDPECLVFRQFVKVRTFENGVQTFTPLQSCKLQLPRSASNTGFVEEQQTCFFGGARGAGDVAWHDVPGTRWKDLASEPTFALFDFTVRVMIWDRCRGEAEQTQEGRLVLRKNYGAQSAEVEPFHAVANTFTFSSPKAKC